MARINKKKLNMLLTEATYGAVLPSGWFRERGISNKLVWWYVHSGWLERIGANAYRRLGDAITWVGAVYCLEELIRLPIHIGGKTALIILGRSHYLPTKRLQTIILFTQPAVKIPGWLNKSSCWNEEFTVIRTKFFEHNKLGLVKRNIENLKVKLSSSERAILEVMHLVPKNEAYEEALLLMENLTNLRPNVVQELLEHCHSIKAKRLFLHCADKCNHPWVADIDVARINLGSGKRKIGKGGSYDPKYLLSVPKIRID